MSASKTSRQTGAANEGHLILKTGIMTVVVLIATHLLSDPTDACVLLERTQAKAIKFDSLSGLAEVAEELSRTLGCRSSS